MCVTVWITVCGKVFGKIWGKCFGRYLRQSGIVFIPHVRVSFNYQRLFLMELLWSQIKCRLDDRRLIIRLIIYCPRINAAFISCNFTFNHLPCNYSFRWMVHINICLFFFMLPINFSQFFLITRSHSKTFMKLSSCRSWEMFAESISLIPHISELLHHYQAARQSY